MTGEEGSQYYSALVVWLATLTGDQPDENEDVSDGVRMAKALHRLDPDKVFTSDWLHTKMRLDRVGENVRLKAGNLRKVLTGIQDYNADVLGIKFNQSFTLPDIQAAAQGDKQHLSRLLQLLLGCAVNCDQKQLYIENIMNMEESVQQLIMQAIQELLDHQELVTVGSGGGEGGSGGRGSVVGFGPLDDLTPSDIRKLMAEYETANGERETLKQRCHELENQVNMLQDEKSNISAEFEQLQAQVTPRGHSLREDAAASRQHKDLRRQLETANDELYKMEKERDESHLKVEELEKRLEESQTKEAEMAKVVEQARALKDEVDILRETSDKASKMESAVESYKKKMEEMGDVKRQLKLMEEKYTRLVETNLDLEEDVRKTESRKPQVDAYKREITDLRSKLDLEAGRADKLEFETKNLMEKVEGLTNEKDRLVHERDKLKESRDELQDRIVARSGTAGDNAGTGQGLSDLEPESGMLEMIPPSVRERLVRLEHENKRLKQQQSSSVNGGGMQQVVDEMKEQREKLESSNRKLNQKIMELEAKVEESANKPVQGTAAASVPRVPGSREELELKLADANKKYQTLQETLQCRDRDMQVMEEKYKRYIEKAKSVIKTLDPQKNPSTGGSTNSQLSSSGGSGNEAVLKSQLSEKERMIESLEHETEKARAVREMEERLISSAFYNLSMQMHRTAVENRLSNVHSSSSTHGQSFLARQRQQQQHAQQGYGGTSGGGASGVSSRGGEGGNNAFLHYADNRGSGQQQQGGQQNQGYQE